MHSILYIVFSDAVDECFSLNAGECIDYIHTRAGGIVDGLEFTTSSGNVYGPWGNFNGGTSYQSTAADGECLVQLEVDIGVVTTWGPELWVSRVRYYFGALSGDCLDRLLMSQ